MNEVISSLLSLPENQATSISESKSDIMPPCIVAIMSPGRFSRVVSDGTLTAMASMTGHIAESPLMNGTVC